MKPESTGLRRQLYEIIFEADTPAGRRFDILLIGCILASVVVVMLDSVHEIAAEYYSLLHFAEWVFTAIFTVEYLLRLYSIQKPWRYATSFFGVVDLLAILPTFIALLLPGAQFLLVIRILRVLRVFRVLKLAQHLSEAQVLAKALKASQRKIQVFIAGVLSLVVILGSLMYLIEGEAGGFTSIPRSMYWAIVTLTTVGYGDISPKTPWGQALASVVMILGYAIIAVPTGIVSAELSQATLRGRPPVDQRACPGCGVEGHGSEAKFCQRCGTAL
ncbi:MAG: ion transporter [bacterium]|nr:ion transporter [bacterium]